MSANEPSDPSQATVASVEDLLRAWRLRRLVPEAAAPSRTVDRAVHESINRESRILAVAAARQRDTRTARRYAMQAESLVAKARPSKHEAAYLGSAWAAILRV